MFWLTGLVFILSAGLTGVARAYALRRGLIDRPNSRSSHNIETPRGGGVAFVLVFLTALIWSFIYPVQGTYLADKLFVSLLLGGGLVALIGFIDDHQHVPIGLRFLVHILAAVVVVWVLGVPPIDLGIGLLTDGWWLSALFVIALVWLLNLYNFMDGIDGIASLQAISVLCEAVIILMLNQSGQEVTIWLLMLALSITGFLIWNWPPAKIFMGDAASGFLGFSLGVFALYTTQFFTISVWSWLILLGLFVVDASWTLGVRVLRGERWHQPHAKHAYQILARQRYALNSSAGMPTEQARTEAHKWVVIRSFLINLCWLLPLAWLASVKPGYGLLLTFVAFLPLLFLVRRVGAGLD
ncbi:MAG: glycosyltransferase family 4 protein [Candidatus Thiodiazotropha sp. (ex. Lucinoma kazani)]